MPSASRTSRRPATALAALAAAALVLCGAIAPAVPAAAATGGSVTVSPAKTEAQVAAGVSRIPLTITNQRSAAVDVSLAAVGLGQRPDGTATFSGSPAAPTRLDTDGFVLAAGNARTVSVSVTVSADTASVYEAVLVTMRPTGGTTSGITAQSRIAALIELTGPGVARPGATVSDVTASGDQSSGHITFSADVHNTGDILIEPAGTATIRRGATVLATVPLAPERILPGAAVDYSGAWNSTVRLDGEFTVDVRLTDPAATGTGTIRFSAGAAPSIAAAIGALRTSTDRHGATIRMDVASTGNTALPATVTITAFDGHDVHRLATTRRTIAAGTTATITETVPLSSGSHILSAVVADPSGTVLDQRQFTVRIPAAIPWSALVAAAVLVVALAVAVSLLIRARRRRSRRGRRSASDPS